MSFKYFTILSFSIFISINLVQIYHVSFNYIMTLFLIFYLYKSELNHSFIIPGLKFKIENVNHLKVNPSKFF